MTTLFYFSYFGPIPIILIPLARIVLYQTFSVIANPNSLSMVTQIQRDQLEKSVTKPLASFLGNDMYVFDNLESYSLK